MQQLHISVVLEIGHDFERRQGWADCLVGNQVIRFISVYAPTTAREWKPFFQYLQEFAKTPAKLFVCGHYNCVLSKRGTNSNSRINGGSTAELQIPLDVNNFVEAQGLSGATDIKYTGRGCLTQHLTRYISRWNVVQSSPVPSLIMHLSAWHLRPVTYLVPIEREHCLGN